MTTNRVYVTVRETYDLSTLQGKLGFIGIHTPTTSNSVKGWSRQLQGLLRQFRYIRFTSCNVALACASPMSLDPLQVGNEAGYASPQDVFNPILYTAVSNESMSTLLRRIYNIPQTATGRVTGSMATTTQNILDVQNANNTELIEIADPLETYYGLLAGNGFRKAMPQSGLEMSDLRPFVHLVAATQPISSAAAGDVNTVEYPAGVSTYDTGFKPQYLISGGTIQMPRQPTRDLLYNASDSAIAAGSIGQIINPIPPVWVGAVILPPAIMQKLYYRMVVTWNIEFSEFMPWEDSGYINEVAQIGRETYYSDYAETSAAMTAQSTSIDAGDMTIDPIMTQVG